MRKSPSGGRTRHRSRAASSGPGHSCPPDRGRGSGRRSPPRHRRTRRGQRSSGAAGPKITLLAPSAAALASTGAAESWRPQRPVGITEYPHPASLAAEPDQIAPQRREQLACRQRTSMPPRGGKSLVTIAFPARGSARKSEKVGRQRRRTLSADSFSTACLPARGFGSTKLQGLSSRCAARMLRRRTGRAAMTSRTSVRALPGARKWRRGRLAGAPRL